MFMCVCTSVPDVCMFAQAHAQITSVALTKQRHAFTRVSQACVVDVIVVVVVVDEPD